MALLAALFGCSNAKTPAELPPVITGAMADAGGDAGPVDAGAAGTEVSSDATDSSDSLGSADLADGSDGAPADGADAAGDGADSEVDQPSCASSADCPAATPYCDLATLQCASCLVGGHCPGVGARCTDHTCHPAVACSNDKACLAFSSVCDKVAGYCVHCLDNAACQAPQTCQANACLDPPKPCATSKDCATQGLVCAGNQCVDCSEDGECAPAQWCSQSFCVPDGCTAGAGTCIDDHTLKSCSANGSQWVTAPCPDNHLCKDGSCVAKVCIPGALRCSGLKTEKCIPTGTGWQLEVDCATSDLACLNGACITALCKAGSKTCLTAGLSTCNPDLLAWGEPSPCGPGSSCANGACLPWDCTPSTGKCDGQVAMACSADGLSELLTDCAKDGNVCELGKCKPTFCKIGAVQCQGKQLAKCQAPGDAWTLSSCDDGLPCTQDGCDMATGACVSSKVDCSDGNSCTLDQCDAATGKCSSVGVDGLPCSAQDKCALGSCYSGTCYPGQQYIATIPNSKADLGGQPPFMGYSGLALGHDGTLWIADRFQHRIRMLSKDGILTTVSGLMGLEGQQDGPAVLARFNGPTGLAVDKAGMLYIADTSNHRIRRMTPGGTVTTVAGSVAGYADGPGSQAKFKYPMGLAFDAAGNLYICDGGNARIRKIAPDGTVSTVAGTGVTGYLDGPASTATLTFPQGIAVDANGSLLVTDSQANRVRRIDLATSEVSTFAGAGYGTADGPASKATFANPGPIAVTQQGAVVFDMNVRRFRRISGGNVVTTNSTIPTQPTPDGLLVGATFSTGGGIAADSKGGIYFDNIVQLHYISPATVVCDDASPCTVEACVASSGSCTVTTAIAGSTCSDDNACTSADQCGANGKCIGLAKPCDDGNVCTEDYCMAGSGVCESLPLQGPCSDGNACTPGDQCLNGQCESNLARLSTLAGRTTAGMANGIGSQATFGEVRAAMWLANGNALVLDSTNHAIRMIKPDGAVSTYCGGNGAGYVDGPCNQAKFANPSGFAADAAGSLYVADTSNHRIRKISAAGMVTTFAGTGLAGHQDGPGSAAAFKAPGALAMGPGGVITVADQGNFRLRQVAADGSVTTLAGAGVAGKQDGAASSATFSSAVLGLAYDSKGRLWIADSGNFAIRRMDDSTSVLTLNSAADAPLDGPVASAKFRFPYQLATSPSGMVYITDTNSCKIRWLSPSGQVGTLMGTMCGYGDGHPGNGQLWAPRAISVGPLGKLLISDGYRIRLVHLAKMDCSDGSPCTLDACDPASATCTSKPIAEGGLCDDEDPCTAKETCTKGSCGGGQPSECDDNDGCTADSCDKLKGCSFVPIAGPGCCLPVLWANSFDTKNLNGIAITTTSPVNNKWQINHTPPNAIAKSAPGVLWFGDGAKNLYQPYPHTVPPANKAITPAIALPAGAAAKVTCSILMDAYVGAKGATDDVYVYLHVDGQKIPIWDKGQGIAVDTWYDISFDLTPYAGKSVQIEFEFTKMSYYSLSSKGVFVDDLEVTRTCK